MDNETLREIAMKMIKVGVDAADPTKLLSPCVKRRNLVLPDGTRYHNDDFSEVLLFAVGKGSQRMALAFDKWRIDDGLVIVDKRAKVEDINLPIHRCSHPLPSEENVQAAQEFLSKLKGKKDALIIFLVSGGASSLFCLPDKNIPLQDVVELNGMLISSGATIHEINTVRKHISQVKGGRFADFCKDKGTLISLIISDVVGDDLSDVASGPTVPDKTTFDHAEQTLKRYSIWENTPKSIRDHIGKGKSGGIPETPTKVEAHNYLAGSNYNALQAAAEESKKHSIPPLILTSRNQGEAREVAKTIIGIAKECQDRGKPAETPVSLLIGGEMTTDVSKTTGSHRGGPNREFVLSSAVQLKNRSNMVVAAVDTDGVDGKGKAGAIADCQSIERSKLDPFKALEDHSTESFFDEINDSIELPITTNVNDLIVVVIGKK